MKVRMDGEHTIILTFDNSTSCARTIKDIRSRYEAMIHD